MSEPLAESRRPGGEFCWRAIGVGGDRSCPELATAIHCRNCGFFSAGGRRLMERRAPPGYLEEWAEVLAAPKRIDSAVTRSALLFRLGAEWLALDTAAVVEVAERRRPHRIPHRGGLLSGLVNIRGQLQLCVSLHRLLGIPEPSAGGGAAVEPRGRLVVAKGGERSWVFGVEEVHGIHRFSADALTAVPLTVAEAQRRITVGLFALESRWIGYLESDALFAAFRVLG